MRQPNDAGERALIAAVLLLALEDVRTSSGARGNAAWAWIFAHTQRGAFSFDWCTEILGVDPGRAREQLMREAPIACVWTRRRLDHGDRGY